MYDSNPEYGFCSLDVVSMFDNLSMDAVRFVLTKMNLCVENQSVVSIRRLMDLITIDSDIFDTFKYRSPTIPPSTPEYYHQRKGIFMGGNTSSIYADIFMNYSVVQMKGDLERLGVKIVRKYVDDFLLYLPKVNFSAVLELFKSNTALDFTIEEPVDGCIPYLDFLVKDQNGILTTQW